MKTILTLILLCCLTAQAQFSPVKDPRGFVGGYFKGKDCVFTNVSFNLANGTTYGVFDQYGGFIFLDYAGNQRFVWDPSSDDWSFISTNGTVKIEVDHNNKLTLNAPVLSGALTGNISGATNASPDIATNNASATDGMALVKRGNNLSLETVAGGSATNAIANVNGTGTNTTIKGLVMSTASGGATVNVDNYSGTDFHFGNLSFSNISSGVYMLAPFASSLLQYRFGDTSNVLASAGSSLNGVGLTNGSVTVPGDLSVAGTMNLGTANVTNLYSVATGNTNRVTIWGPNGNATNVSLVNLTLDTGVFPATLTASTGSGSTGSNIVDNGYAAEARNINISTNLTVTSTNLGTTITLRSISTNASLAAVGAQQVSPATMWFGNGWMTTPSASTNVGMGVYLLPVQGAATPTAALHFLQKIGGAAIGSVGNIDNSGTLNLSGAMLASSVVQGTAFRGTGSTANFTVGHSLCALITVQGTNTSFSGFIAATNGYSLIDSGTFPTSSIPVGNASFTNAQWIMYKGFPHIVATNRATTTGWMESTNALWWPFTP